MEKTFCRDCICWDNSYHTAAKEDTYGFCHYWPPAGHEASNLVATFPKTHADFFCFQGEKEKVEYAEPTPEIIEG